MIHYHSSEGGEAPSDTNGGFVLGLVVLLLFAIAVGTTAGYQMVNNEILLSKSDRQGREALVVARAGLERFIADQVGNVGDSVSYAIGDGVALVTSRLVYQEDADNHLYYIESEGTVTEPRNPDDPSRRRVGTYAWHRIAPLPHMAAIFVTDAELEVKGKGNVDGEDNSSFGDCLGAGTLGVYGIATGGTVKGSKDVKGHPAAANESFSGYNDVYAAMKVRWDILEDPEFPVDFDGTPPSDWSTIPEDSFPISRTETGLNQDERGDWSGGRGVLIVRDSWRPRGEFEWTGIVLAGRLAWTTEDDDPDIEGMVFAGFNTHQQDEILEGGTFQYNYCSARAANEALSYLEKIDNAIYEVN